MNQAIQQIKHIHKDLASKIREHKALRKAFKWKDQFKYESSLQYAIQDLSKESRLRHIAYCLNRGREYDQIEKPRETNMLTSTEWSKIQAYQEEYKKLYEEANVRVVQPAARVQ